MDPEGAGLIMGEYMDFLYLKFLGFAAKPLGTAFALAETIIGTALITGVWRKTFGVAAMAFQGFFTLLTLALVIFNPTMDCGCFGEAIHLTHMETFLKNIVLCILLSAYLFPAKMLGEPKAKKYVTFAVVTTSVVAFMAYSWMYIPLVDYTAYKPGAVLKASEAAPAEEAFEAVFIYEKDGKEETFDLEHLPDSTWTFVRTDTRATAGSSAEDMVDLSFYNSDGEYMDETAAEGRVMVISLHKTDISTHKWEEISGFVHNAEDAGFKAIVLASDVPADTHGLEVYIADYKTLLAMNRSNGGVTYFSDGNLIRKWAFRARPDMERLNELYNEDATETVIYHNAKGSLAFQGFLLYVFAVMLLL